MSIYNEDELIAPDWINQEFLQKVLIQYEKTDKVKLIDFDLSPASLKGDHYGSIMFRCKVDYNNESSSGKKQTRNFVIKTLPQEDCSKRELLKESGVFETEISMYSETIPLIEKILKENGEPTKLGAGLIYASIYPHKVIIMEDLCESGYQTIRGRYLTEDEVKLILKKIAKFHAVTYSLGHSEENSHLVTKYDKGLFCNSTIIEMDLIRNGIKNFIATLEEYEEFAQYLPKFKAIERNLLTNCMQLYNAYNLNDNKNAKDIFVLNHGDFHLKNLMFKFDKNGVVEDVIMVDYQLNCYAPSTIDTTYSQYLLMSPELRLRRNEFMHNYFTEFIRILKKLNYMGELPLYSDFQIASYKYKDLGLFLLSTFLPLFEGVIVSKAENLQDLDSTNLMDDNNFLISTYKKSSYLNALRQYLPILLKDGYLD